MAQRIGLYGGSFNPVHRGHLTVARSIVERIGLDRVVLLPSAQPPHKDANALIDGSHRARMVQLAIVDEPLLEFSDFDLRRDGPSFTIDTVNHFREVLGAGALIHWIIGADSLAELTTWHRLRDLLEACTVVTAMRPGWDRIDWEPLRAIVGDDQTARLRSNVLDTPLMDISSTEIRARAGRGLSIRHLVPDCVAEYVNQHALYRSNVGRGH